MSLKRTALYDEHVKLNGRIIDFGGWELPVQYTGVIDEHLACRNAAGLFDVSHMGEFWVEGNDAEEFLNFCVSNNLKSAKPYQAQYSALCNDRGGIVDDLIVYKFSTTKFLVVVNASNTDKDFSWMKKIHSEKKFSCLFENRSAQYSQIAIQGPKAIAILQKLTDGKLSEIKTFMFAEGKLKNGVSVILGRTGYTGEDGFEIYMAWNDGPTVWKSLLEVGVSDGLKPCGLGARDTLRLEVKYPLYGQELTDETSPLEAGIGWAVKLDKGEFMGRPYIEKAKAAGLKKKLVGIELKEAGIPRTGYKLFTADGGREIGWVTSGTQSPCSKKSIGIVYLETSQSEVGNKVTVDIRGRKISAEVVPTPFYKRPY